jgi:hypothetical protein
MYWFGFIHWRKNVALKGFVAFVSYDAHAGERVKIEGGKEYLLPRPSKTFDYIHVVMSVDREPAGSSVTGKCPCSSSIDNWARE